MNDDVRIRNTVKTENLAVDEFYSLDALFNELERLQDENESLKRALSDLQDDIEENYRKKSPYELCGMRPSDFI